MATFGEILSSIDCLLDIPEEELSAEEKVQLDEALVELAQLEVEKVDNLAQYITLETKRIEAIKEEAKRLSTRAKSATSRIEKLKQYALDNITSRGLKKLSGEVYTLSTRKSTRVEVDCTPDSLPEEYRVEKTEIVANKMYIGQVLKSGGVVPNCRLQENVSLQIK